jgi:hypothetical protein
MTDNDARIEMYFDLSKRINDYLNCHNYSKSHKNVEQVLLSNMINIRKSYDSLIKAESEIHKSLDRLVKSDCDSLETILLEPLIFENKKLSNIYRSMSGCYDPCTMEAPAFIFVLDYDPTNTTFKEHMFNGEWYDEPINYDNPLLSKELRKIAYQDGASVFDLGGKLVAKKVLLDNLNLNSIIEKNSKYYDSSSSVNEKMGFLDDDVNARNKNSLAFSYHVPDSVVYVLTASGNIRRFENGEITHSTIKEESKMYCKYVDFNDVYFSRKQELIFSK